MAIWRFNGSLFEPLNGNQPEPSLNQQPQCPAQLSCTVANSGQRRIIEPSQLRQAGSPLAMAGVGVSNQSLFRQSSPSAHWYLTTQFSA